jgi:hypothetical protein
MNPKKPLVAVLPQVLFILSAGSANAGKTLEEAGAIACVIDKWDETELQKGHKLAEATMRCVVIPDDPAAQKYAEDCVGKYEFMPNGSWKGGGTCNNNFKGGDKSYETWEEGSHLKEYIYKITGGTGKYEGAGGGGTYSYENLTDRLAGGKYRGKLELP